MLATLENAGKQRKLLATRENAGKRRWIFHLKKLPRLRSRLKGMPQKDLISIRNYDVRHLIPKVCSAVLKNGAEILKESIVK